MFFESYGNATIRALTRASRRFFEQPPVGFSEVALMAPRGALFVADAPRMAHIDQMLSAPEAGPRLRRLDAKTALEMVPI